MLTAELNRTRRIGAEYEVAVPLVGSGTGMDIQRMLANVLSANGIRAIARGYSHDPLPPNVDVAVEYDSSVQGESRWQGVHWFPVEIKTRILDGLDDWEAIIPKTLDIARYLGGRITPSCGHHLHLSFEEIRQDARHVRSLWNLCHRFEPVLFGLVAPSRRNNHYCHAMPSTPKLLHGANSLQSLRRVLAAYDRYQGLNTTHLLGSSPRVELRYHQGTLDPVKARHWLRFCLQLIQHAVTRTCQAADAPVANDRQGMERLLVTIGLKVNSKVYATVSPELRQTGKFMLRRWKDFNGSIALKRKPRTTSEETEATPCAR